MGKKINTYFEDRAAGYLDKSNHGIWGLFRQKERSVITKLLDAKTCSSLLDLGSGAGYYSIYFKENSNLDVLAIDSSFAMIEQLKIKGIPCEQLSIEKLENIEKRGPYDNALAAGVLEFIEFPENFFKSISTLIKPGGRLVILIPVQGFFGWGYGLAHVFAGCRVFIRRTDEYEKLATQYGFKKINQEEPTVISQVICFEKN